MKYLVGVMLFVLAIAGFATPLKGADAETRPFVTEGPGDQKANMGLYDDAKGPPWGNVPYVAIAYMPFGSCSKPGVVVNIDEHGNEIYAADDEVIWRCVQGNSLSGEWYDRSTHPLVYCHIQREQPAGRAKAWRCYHDYSVVFDFYEHDYGRSPLILPDEIEFIDTTEMR